MNQGRRPITRKSGRARVKRVCILLIAGLLLIGAGPAFAYLALNYSGRLALAQQASASDVTRGIDFGPVFLEEGVPGRYYLSAKLPQCPAGYWQTRFTVLDENKVPVFSEDEIRFIGEFMFQPGQYDRYCKDFTLEKDTGYYYFRYSSVNGAYTEHPADPPVLAFSIRQDVMTDYVLWGPVAGLILLGLALVTAAVRIIQAIASEIATADEELRARQEAERHASPDKGLAGLSDDAEGKRPAWMPRTKPWMPGWRPSTDSEG